MPLPLLRCGKVYTVVVEEDEWGGAGPGAAMQRRSYDNVSVLSWLLSLSRWLCRRFSCRYCCRCVVAIAIAVALVVAIGVAVVVADVVAVVVAVAIAVPVRFSALFDSCEGRRRIRAVVHATPPDSTATRGHFEGGRP